MKKFIISIGLVLSTSILLWTNKSTTGIWGKGWFSTKQSHNQKKPVKKTQGPINTKNPNLSNEKKIESQKKQTENWQRMQQEIVTALKNMFKDEKKFVQFLSKEIAQEDIVLLDPKRKTIYEYFNSPSIKNFKTIEEDDYTTFVHLFDESLGMLKVTELRSALAHIQDAYTFEDAQNDKSHIYHIILSLIDQIYSSQNTTSDPETMQLRISKTLSAMLQRWKIFEKEIQSICKKNKIFFTQDNGDGQEFLQSKLEILEDYAEKTKQRMVKFAQNNEFIEPMVNALIEGINNQVESFKYLWGFYSTFDELQKSIEKTFETTKLSMKQQLKNIVSMDLNAEGFEKFEEDEFGVSYL